MAEVETKEMRNMANISISTSFCRSVAALRLTTLLGLLAEKRVADKADVVLRVVLMSLPNRHLTDGEQHGWRPQSQRYGQISLPTSTKKVLVIVIVIVIVVVIVIVIVITDSFWHSFGHFMHSFQFLLFNEFFIKHVICNHIAEGAVAK